MIAAVILSTCLSNLNKRSYMEKRSNAWGFRARPENQERLEFAEKIGINVSELINELLKDYLKPRLEKKVKAVREAVAAPVP